MNEDGTIRNDSIVIKQYITPTQFAEINRLEAVCRNHDGTNLKLETEYRLNRPKSAAPEITELNEFLYYADGELAAYLGIASFGGGNAAELNGMTHPDFRRKGIFSRLYGLALAECRKRGFDKILLLSDGKSGSGQGFIRSVSGTYDFSEYRMRLQPVGPVERSGLVSLRKAGNGDVPELEKLDTAIFGGIGEERVLPEEEELRGEVTYLVNRGETAIGRIKITYSDSAAFISGFGIVPECRGRGFGKAALREALQLIREQNIPQAELDVECKNSNALHLYTSCGFQDVSVMDYYQAPEKQAPRK
ncbi:GNAT family N-acetyltransferase [Paenibacillus sp. YN15]|uniref:GNAT family N-acetyltransferase n=1 Tax=Paenibacillus sp. YN15 TaxID=1742774 RepID=UPI000DCC0273|nr:GNAT family N-acetyltransferase [Paenibacillus sp. YN15]RAU92004.1 GNAT family N-acetyltransferase [Paenibacillus sp. YN15]